MEKLMFIQNRFTRILWAISGLILVYDGVFDALTSTNHGCYFDVIEAIVGVIILALVTRSYLKQDK